MLRLPELQRAFFRALTQVHGGTERLVSGPDVIAEIRGDDRLGAAERVEIYAHMYRARLIDALAEDYPRVAAILGAERFAELAHRYLTVHPSTHPSLRWFGQKLGELLTETDGSDLPAFLGDLARLEWARLTVFDAPDADVLALDALRTLPPDDWAGLRLRLVPAAELLRTAWPVQRIWDTAAPESSACDWHPEETWLRVWRQDAKVYQASMDLTERTALTHVQAGDEFAALCAGLARVVPSEAAAETAGALILRWIDDGLLLAAPKR